MDKASGSLLRIPCAACENFSVVAAAGFPIFN
jgi:hypothetical protein